MPQAGKFRSRDVLDLVYGRLSAKAVTAGHRDMLRFVELTGIREGEVVKAGCFSITKSKAGFTLMRPNGLDTKRITLWLSAEVLYQMVYSRARSVPS